MFIGIDPGVTGALVVRRRSGETIWSVHRTPVIKIKRKYQGEDNKTKISYRTYYDPAAMVKLLRQYPECEVVVIEEIGVLATGKLAIASLNRGMAYWHMAAVACGYPVTLVKPEIWKPEMLKGRLPKGVKYSDKEAVRMAALNQFPALADDMQTPGEADVAEAAYLATYGQLKWGMQHGDNISIDRPVEEAPAAVSGRDGRNPSGAEQLDFLAHLLAGEGSDTDTDREGI